MLKCKTLAYDGRGNFVLRDLSHVKDALEFLGGRPLYAEKWVPFVKEIAVMVVRTAAGQTYSYPVVETVHKDNICHLKTISATLYSHPFETEIPSLQRALKK